MNDRAEESRSKANAVKPKRIIIDTDAGIDDAQAIVMALESDDLVEVVAITTCHGNVDVDQVNRNVQRILRVIGKPWIPVYSGSARSLIGGRLSASFYHGNDGLGDVSDSSPADAEVEPEHAVQALIRIVNENIGEITVLCLAPLTNIALAIRIDPEFGRKLKDCVVMGGNYKGRGNITASAEFNFRADPEAARVVLRELDCQRIVLVTWELCFENSLTWEWYDKFINTDTTVGRFFRKVESKTLATYYSNKDTAAPYITCDQLAAAIVLDPEVITEGQKISCDVELNGELTRGQMVVDWQNRSKRRSNVYLVSAIDIDRYKNLLYIIVKETKDGNNN